MRWSTWVVPTLSTLPVYALVLNVRAPINLTNVVDLNYNADLELNGETFSVLVDTGRYVDHPLALL